MIMYSVVNLGGSNASRAEARRHSSTLAKEMLRTLLQVLTGVPGPAWTLTADGRGKPTAFSHWQSAMPDVSITHSGNWIAVAVSNAGPVGIDIEYQRPGRDVAGIAEASFGEKERIEVSIGGPNTFYRVWTLREAIAKALGAGLPMVIDKVDRVSRLSAGGKCSAQIDNLSWLLSYSQPTDGIHLALAVVSHFQDWPDGTPVQVELHIDQQQFIQDTSMPSSFRPSC